MDTQFIVRPVALKDRDSLLKISANLGPGLTNIPRTKAIWQQKIESSVLAFKTAKRGENNFFFVLEDVVSQTITGFCAIFTGIGNSRPNYHYRCSYISHYSQEFDKRFRHKTISFCSDLEGCNELASLYLDSKVRGTGTGKLLSLSRMLLMAQHPDLFDTITFADIRGHFDEKDQSPFWELFMSKFFDLEYNMADMHSANNFQFFVDLMPKYPIYVNLLPEQAKGSIGKHNSKAEGAVRNLLRNGFRKSDYIDIFDGGPNYICETENITTIRKCQSLPVSKIVHNLSTKPRLLANSSITNFAAISAAVAIEDDSAIITASTAKALDIEIQNTICIL